MKRLLLVICCAIIILPCFITKYAYSQDDLVLYKGPVEHVFTHCLLADPELSFNKDNPMRKDYDIDCITKDEFKKALTNLYNNNYVLVDIYSIYHTKNGIAKKQHLYLPKGKKPLILSFDDVNYDHRKMSLGMIDKLILDKNGNLASFTSNKTPQINYDDEFVLIVENFIKKHPDFSFNNARGVLCLTGYDGILGYRIQHKNPNYKQEIKQVQPIVNKLKQLGWRFASHSFGHYHMKNISNEHFRQEVVSWQTQVEPIVGKTEIYVYPYGEWEIFDKDGNISYKHQLLQDAGFKLFCGVGIQPYFSYLPNKKGNKVLFMDRTPFDGNTFRSKATMLKRLIDVNAVYDHSLRPSKLI